MCFSAGASFAASGVFAVVGVASIKNAKSNEQIPFAAIPFLFAVQQSAEGALWIELADGSSPSQVPIYIFLILAQLVWPAWVPWSVLLLEQNGPRAKIIKAILAIGIAISLYLLYCLFVYKVNAEIYAGHIKYYLDFPLAMVKASNILYFIPTVIPLFFSGVKKNGTAGNNDINIVHRHQIIFRSTPYFRVVLLRCNNQHYSVVDFY